jgi:ammonia channel protein AmtB
MMSIPGLALFYGGLVRSKNREGGDVQQGRDDPRARVRGVPGDLRRAITCCLIVGSFAERIKFSAVLAFMVLWFTFSYCRSRTWSGSGKVRTPTPADVVDKMNASAGLIWQWGALDFAGGTVVHINAAVAGLVGALHASASASATARKPSRRTR